MFSYYPRTAASTTARSLSRQSGRRNAATATASTPTNLALKGSASSVRKQSTSDTDSIWESYGFGQKDNGMVAWYFVP
ncbi:hypothetical protein ACA910_008027 [Epithemia clementina (nom. ined.)]